MRASCLLVVVAASLVVPWVTGCSKDDKDANQGGELDAATTQETGIDQDASPSDGPDEPDAPDGTDATDATDGTDATDATDGTDATDATDGTDGTDAPVEAAEEDAPLDQETEPDSDVGEFDAQEAGEWGEFQGCYDCSMLHCGAQVGACFESSTCTAALKCVLADGCLSPSLDYGCAMACAMKNGASLTDPAIQGLVAGGADCVSWACATECGIP